MTCTFMVLFALTPGLAMAEPTPVDGLTSEQMLVLGERIYRQGILPNGEPIKAVVSADVPVNGEMFSCVNCHQRSGLGSIEGSVITWPVNGKELYTPRRRTGAWHAAREKQGPGATQRWSLPAQYQAADARPAYTDETLAKLLREGIDPAGRMLERGMPRYQINDSDMAMLSHYLKNLSTENDEGVDENRIRFATVVTEGVSAKDRQAMLAVLKAHIETHNTQTRPHQRRASAGPFYKTEKYGAYRLFELDIWELTGAPETWRAQLDNYYRQNPVFAMLGGIASGSWAPVHHFCEDRELPCLFPVTDQPVVSDSDWYTLYYSKGFYQEGEAAARYLRTTPDTGRKNKLVQIYRAGNNSVLLAQGFRKTFANNGVTSIAEKKLAVDEPLTEKLLQELFEAQQPAAVLLWLDRADLATTTQWLAKRDRQSVTVLASWSLLDGDTSAIAETVRDNIYLTYPRDLPESNAKKISVLKRWLKIRKIPVTNLDIQSQMYFLGWMLPGAISHMRSEFFRDYFIESFDMMRDQDYAIAVFPRLTFGPGQRYAAKGCYIVQLGQGEQPALIKKSEWIIH
ncbi:MAG: ABC transporter substrate-binding protein [Gammaproteobacteria bacterium]|nr:ABC transporter substrate-binding protein [Gammaproteobacteria bacterium]